LKKRFRGIKLKLCPAQTNNSRRSGGAAPVGKPKKTGAGVHRRASKIGKQAAGPAVGSPPIEPRKKLKDAGKSKRGGGR